MSISYRWSPLREAASLDDIEPRGGAWRIRPQFNDLTDGIYAMSIRPNRTCVIGCEPATEVPEIPVPITGVSCMRLRARRWPLRPCVLRVRLPTPRARPVGLLSLPGPCGPVSPSCPAGPVGPWGPVAPSEPSCPAIPCGPWGPVVPSGPTGPSHPRTRSMSRTVACRSIGGGSGCRAHRCWAVCQRKVLT